MNDMLVATFWMAGVLAMMGLFGIAAAVGYVRAKRNGTLTLKTEENEI